MRTMNYEIARAIATDKANRNMRKNDRKQWDEEDYDMACETFNKLWKGKAESL